MPPIISVEYRDRIAIITINNPKKLGALTQQDYFELATRMNEVATHDEIFITVIFGTGRFFSAGADVSISRSSPPSAAESRKFWLQTFAAFNLHSAHAFAHHPKILVVGLNGPVVGLTAALISHADFIYCTPRTYLLTPFSSLGLVAEGGSSYALMRRLGVARANEALIMSKRLGADVLQQCGFVNDVFDEDKFDERVLGEVHERLGGHLNGESLLGIKALMRRPEREVSDAQNLREVMVGVERFVRGIPQEEFRKLVSGEKRHKL